MILLSCTHSKYKYADHKNCTTWVVARVYNGINGSKEIKWVNCLILGAGCYDFLADKQFRSEYHDFLTKKI